MDQSIIELQKLGASVILGLLAWFLYSKFRKSDARKTGKKMPPGPRPWPIVGNLPLLGTLLHQDFNKLSQTYGPIFHLVVGSIDVIVISAPTLAEEVLKARETTLAARPRSSWGKFVAYNHSTTSLSPYGPYWRHARKVYALQLMTVKRFRQFEKERSAELLRAIDSIINGCKEGKAVRIDETFWMIICNNICNMAISKTYVGDTSRTATLIESRVFEQTITDMFRLLIAPVPGDFIPLLRNFDIGGYRKHMREVSRQMDEILESTMEEHQHKLFDRTNPESGGDDKEDLVDTLLADSSSNNENPLTREQVKALLTEVLGAGIETQITTLNWVFSELLKNPSVLSRAQKELENTIGNNRMVQEADLPHLPYIQAIVNETFRFHPAVPLLGVHQFSEDLSLGDGHYIPENSHVFINAWAMGRDSTLWENPLEFKPERFLDTNIDTNGYNSKFLPFGFGRRICPGKQLGLLMVEHTVAVLLHACNWALPQGLSPKDIDMREAPGMTAPRMVPLEIVASPRLPLSVIFAT